MAVDITRETCVVRRLSFKRISRRNEQNSNVRVSPDSDVDVYVAEWFRAHELS